MVGTAAPPGEAPLVHVVWSAWINRRGEGDESALHRRASDPRWPRPCVRVREDTGEGLVSGYVCAGLEPRNVRIRGADAVTPSGRPRPRRRYARAVKGPCAVSE